MVWYSVETVNDCYTTYSVEAESEEDAKRAVYDALARGGENMYLQSILDSGVVTGYGDHEEVIDVSEMEM